LQPPAQAEGSNQMETAGQLPTGELKRNFGSRLWFSSDRVPQGSEYVLLWVQQAVRIENNHALAAAISLANSLGLPLYAYFGLDPHYPGANARHFDFLLQGLVDLEENLARLGIPLLVDKVNPEEGVARAAEGAACVVGDRGYTRRQRRWRSGLKRRLSCPLLLLESDIVVPAGQASDKEEYSAATLRRKLQRLTDIYLTPVHLPQLRRKRTRATPLPFRLFAPLAPGDARGRMGELGINTRVAAQTRLCGGETAAAGILKTFLDRGLSRYAESRNDPGLDFQSELSPYLHFGQISPLTAALAVMRHSARAPSQIEGAAAFLEQLIVRRELAVNFCIHNPACDSPESAPDWARRSLAEHAADPRPVVYSRQQLLAAETEDPYWNAAMKELLVTGKMHGYMRMYWEKKLLEWMPDWREAWELLVELNDTYSLDGRDPNGYAGIAWVFGKHDRPFPERPCFGKLRPMGAKGLKRKFEMELYLSRVNSL
jgi:deoxyribodipyrimidine photo-lyase